MTVVPRDLRQQQRRRRRKISTKTSTKTMEASADDRRSVQEVIDNDGGGSGSMTGLMDCQRQRSVSFPCYRVTNSNTVSSLSCRYLVLLLFSSDSFFLFTARNTISTAIMWKIFLYQVYTNLAYVSPTYRRVKKLQVLMINKNLHKSLASRNGNEILI